MTKYKNRPVLLSLPPEVKYKIASYLHLSATRTQIKLLTKYDDSIGRALNASEWDQFNPSYYILESEIFEKFINQGYNHVKCLVLDHTTFITSEVKHLFFPKLKSIRIMSGFCQYEELAVLTKNNPHIHCLELNNDAYIDFWDISSLIITLIFKYVIAPSLRELRLDLSLSFRSFMLILDHFSNLKDLTCRLNHMSLASCNEFSTELVSPSNLERIRTNVHPQFNKLGTILRTPRNFPKLQYFKDYHSNRIAHPFFNRAMTSPGLISKYLQRMLKDRDSILLTNPDCPQALWIAKKCHKCKILYVEFDDGVNLAQSLEALFILVAGLSDIIEDLHVESRVQFDSKFLIESIFDQSYTQSHQMNHSSLNDIPDPINQNHLQNLKKLTLPNTILNLFDFIWFNSCTMLSSIEIRELDTANLPLILSRGTKFQYIKQLSIKNSKSLSNNLTKIMPLFPSLMALNSYHGFYYIGINDLMLSGTQSKFLREICLPQVSLKISEMYQLAVYDQLIYIEIGSIEYEKINNTRIRDIVFPKLKELGIGTFKGFKSAANISEFLKIFTVIEYLKIDRFSEEYPCYEDPQKYMGVQNQKSNTQIKRFACRNLYEYQSSIHCLLCICHLFSIESLSISKMDVPQDENNPPQPPSFSIPTIKNIFLDLFPSPKLNSWIIRFLHLFPQLKSVEVQYNGLFYPFSCIHKTKEFSMAEYLKQRFRQDSTLKHQLKAELPREMYDYYDMETIDNQVHEEELSWG